MKQYIITEKQVDTVATTLLKFKAKHTLGALDAIRSVVLYVSEIPVSASSAPELPTKTD